MATATRPTTRAASSSSWRRDARPKLEQLSYAVLALGDSSYPRFCEAGRQVDERLAALGAKRLFERVDCDVDYEKLATPWVEKVVTGAREALGAQPGRHGHAAAHGAVRAAVLARESIPGRNPGQPAPDRA